MSTATAAPRHLANGWEVCRETPLESGRRVVLAANPGDDRLQFATLVERWGAISEIRFFDARAEAEADYADRAFRET